MPNPVLRSIIRTTDLEEEPEIRRRNYRKKRKINIKPKKKVTKKTPKPRVKRSKAYAGYSNLTNHPLPHEDHQDDYMEHIGHEYKMMR